MKDRKQARKSLTHDDSPALRPYDAKGFREMAMPGRSRLQSGMSRRPSRTASKSSEGMVSSLTEGWSRPDPRGPFSTQHKNKPRRGQARGPFGSNVNSRKRRSGPVNSRGTLTRRQKVKGYNEGFGSM